MPIITPNEGWDANQRTPHFCGGCGRPLAGNGAFCVWCGKAATGFEEQSSGYQYRHQRHRYISATPVRWKPWLAVVSIALAAAVAVSPYYALYTLKSVVVHGDADALAERVNFPVLRENIKEKLRGEIAKQTVQRSGADGTTTDGLNALGVMLGSQFINLAIDQYVNPQFVIQMVQDSSRTHGDNARVPYVASSGYQGINKFYAQIKVPDQAESIGLIFRRSGLLGWQLTDIDLNEIFNAGAPVANTETTRPAPTREWQTPRIDKAITPSSHNAGTMQLVNVPFVGCQSDGQTGPVEAP